MTYPYSAMTLTVELYYSGAWNDVSSYVYYRDGITIVRGRSEPQSNLTQGSATLTFDNRDGRFTPRHPSSPLYGLIGRGTPIRVTADTEPRFYGRVMEWPVTWDRDDVYVSITAGGVFRRLGQGGASVKSAMRRGLEQFTTQIAYWPMEDGEWAREWASPMDGVSPLVPFIGGSTTPPSFASNSDFVCSDPLPVVHGRSEGPLPSYDISALGEVQLRGLFSVPDGAASTVLLDFYIYGTHDHIVLNYVTGSGYLNLEIVDDTTSGWTSTETTSNYDFALNGKSAYISVGLQQDGVHLNWIIDVYEPNASAVLTASGTFTTHVSMYRTRKLRVGGILMGATDGWSIGHVSVDNTVYTMASFTSYVNAHAGETPRSRIERLSLENGMSVSTYGTYGQAMGPQRSETILELLGKAEDVSSGMLWESRYFLDTIAWIGRSSLHNQVPTATLSLAGAGPTDLKPTDDDALVVNDVTVTRDGGAQFRKVITTGPLGTAAVGTYEAGVTLSLFEDWQAADQAGWRAWVGTLDVTRYPTVTMNMARLAMLDTTTYENARSVDIGDVVQLTNIPVDIFPTSTVDIMVIGYTERIDQFEWTVDLVCLPSERYQSWEIDGFNYARLQPEGDITILDVGGIDASDVVINVDVPGTPMIDSATYPTMFPIAAMCEGEEISIDEIVRTTSPQIFNVTRAVNGISKAHAAGAVITLKYLNPIGL